MSETQTEKEGGREGQRQNVMRRIMLLLIFGGIALYFFEDIAARRETPFSLHVLSHLIGSFDWPL